MPLQIVHEDITKMSCDVIVNPTDCFYSGGGGTDYAIHKAAGKELAGKCRTLEPLDFGETEVTPGYGLKCKYIIHTMGPIWQGGDVSEPVLLRSCYLNALIKAKRLGLQSIAFPLISSGAFGFPKDKVLRIAIDAISDFLLSVDSEIDVYICVIDRSSFELSKSIALQEYLDYSKRFAHKDRAPEMAPAGSIPEENIQFTSDIDSEADAYEQPLVCGCASSASFPAAPKAASQMPTLAEWMKQQDDSFAVTLLKLIDAKGMKDVECYKRANVHRNTFWKIKNEGSYKPSKATVIAFAISLQLTLEETKQFLQTAGFSLSHSNTFDMIIEFYITNGVYDVFEINEALYKYDQVCLGC